ncbi:hypothetical protein QW694_29905 [Methylobacterium isbiliense]|nr:hypothetical protein [Methylobacterium isbiliense]MDN3627204.1 hypothetical protein [Methylobacterium isbiliense]
MLPNTVAAVAAWPLEVALLSASAWFAVDFAESTSFWIEVMPWLAAWMVWTPFEMPSSRLERSEDRAVRLCEVKKLVGLSSAELTFLPVDRRDWVVERRLAVSWSESRFWRVAADSVMLEAMGVDPFSIFRVRHFDDASTVRLQVLRRA